MVLGHADSHVSLCVVSNGSGDVAGDGRLSKKKRRGEAIYNMVSLRDLYSDSK